MWRLIRARLHDDRGAVAVTAGFLLVALIGLAAVVVDVGALYAERAQLQNGADAAALAIAADCARGSCGDAPGTARAMAGANANDGAADAEAAVSGTQVTVTASTRTPAGATKVAHRFAGVLSHMTTGEPNDGTTVVARAAAGWGSPRRATTTPLAFSYCEWQQLAGTPPVLPTGAKTVFFHNTSGKRYDCAGPAGQVTPGGWGWLATEAGACSADVRTGNATARTGNSVPNSCPASHWSSLLGRTVMLPVFSAINADGSFRIEGFAALRVEGYRLSGEPAFNAGSPAPCSGDDRCLRGRFVDYVDLSGTVELGGPDYGAAVVRLSN